MLITLLLMFATGLATTLWFVAARRRRTRLVSFSPDRLPPVEEGLATLAGLTNASVYRGNAATLFQNGSLFEAMEADIQAARHTVHLETFVWTKGELERRTVELLCARAAEGVKVRVIVDAVGATEADADNLARLGRAENVELVEYRPLLRWNPRRLNHRTHRKLLIVDGEIGYTFGHGYADHWLGQGKDPNHWRDTGVRLEGPVVQGLQSVFMEHWIEESQVIPCGQGCFPALEEKGTVAAHVVSSAAGDSVSSVSLLYSLAIACARNEVLIQNPYFVPGIEVVELLREVVARGVRVRLMVPGGHTDNTFVRYAGSYLYAGMMKAGVELYEFEPTLLHQKVVVVDGIWSHIGSTNFDERSLALNEEVGVGLLDAGIAQELRDTFERDLLACRRITPERWQRRGLLPRVAAWAAYQVHEQL